MRKQLLAKNALNILGLAAVLLLSATGARLAAAEKVNMSPGAMRDLATDVIVGKVESIAQKNETRDGYTYAHYTAHVKIASVEKGKSLQKGSFCDVRYWHLIAGPKPKKVGNHYVLRMMDTGYRGMPGVGDTRRIYLARNAYDGFTKDNNDGGYNVIAANGFEVPGAPVKHNSPKKMQPHDMPRP